jgi:hypothetical protein
MKGKRFSEEKIIKVLKEADAGTKTSDLCRKHGISEGKLPSIILLLIYASSHARLI